MQPLQAHAWGQHLQAVRPQEPTSNYQTQQEWPQVSRASRRLAATGDRSSRRRRVEEAVTLAFVLGAEDVRAMADDRARRTPLSEPPVILGAKARSAYYYPLPGDPSDLAGWVHFFPRVFPHLFPGTRHVECVAILEPVRDDV
ncbi:DUF6177 family protein [Streptomyces sp. NPDC086989]|uniref:DUF6177 family protein n=1 Tax=Streptomyces sp. NPDC086989 TaxID=3365764 RepID=UPI003814CCF4